MSQVSHLLPQLLALDPSERDQLRAALSGGDAHPLIVSTPGVCGGAARLVRTRIPVWTLENMRRLGVAEAQILESFSSLRPADLAEAWSYVDGNRDEIDAAIAMNEAD